MYRNGGDLGSFVGTKIVAEIMQFIADGLMKELDAPDNIIGRGHITVLMDVFHVNLPMAIQKMKHVLKFCMNFGNGESLPHRMNFSYLQHAWDASNQMLQVLLMPAVDWSVNPDDRTCPICLNPILLRKFGVLACGHLMHMSCWREYKTQMVARSGIVKCLVCNFDT
jgi:hypothetical protein